MDEIKLLPCPFCGGEALVVIDRQRDSNVSYKVAWVQCTVCGVKTPTLTIDGYYGIEHTPADAVKAWNTRANKIPVGSGENYEVIHNEIT